MYRGPVCLVLSRLKESRLMLQYRDNQDRSDIDADRTFAPLPKPSIVLIYLSM